MEKKKIETFFDNNGKEGGGGDAGNKYQMKELFFMLTLNFKTNIFLTE